MQLSNALTIYTSGGVALCHHQTSFQNRKTNLSKGLWRVRWTTPALTPTAF